MQNVEIKKLENSMVEISAEIPADEFESYRKKSVEALGKDVEIDGFRKGHVPEDVLVKKIGEEAVLYEMANTAISAVLPNLLVEHKIDAVGRPEIAITKIAAGNPLAFKAKVAVMPEFDLPEYKKITQDALKEVGTEKFEATDEEVTKLIEDIRRSFAASQKQAKEKEGGKADSGLLGPDGKPLAKEGAEELPELTDEFVKKLGAFENVSDFKEKLKGNIIEEKKAKAKEKQRAKIVERLIEKTDIAVPEPLIEAEINGMLAQFAGNIASMGLKIEDYLKQTGKTEQDMRKDMEKDARTRVAGHLILNKIAEVEKLAPSKEEIAAEAGKLVKFYETQGQKVDPARAGAYVETMLQNEKTFSFLEGGETDPEN